MNNDVCFFSVNVNYPNIDINLVKHNNDTVDVLQGGKKNSIGRNFFMEKDLQSYYVSLCKAHTKKNTIKNYINLAKQYHRFCDGVINVDTVKDYVHHVKTCCNNNTPRIKINGMNLYLKYLGLGHLCVPLPKQKYSVMPTLHDDQMRRLLDVSRLDEETHLMMLLIWDGCLRPDALIHLRLSNRHEDTLLVTHHKTIDEIGPKTIVMSPLLQQAWDSYLRVRPEPNYGMEDYLFICTNTINQGNRYRDIDTIERRIRRLGSVCKINRRVTPLMIRRTSSTLRQDPDSMFYAGDSKLVQNMFHHTDIKTTMRYNNKNNDHVRKYLNRVYAQDKLADIWDNTQDKSYLALQGFNKVFDDEEDETNTSFSFSISSFFNDLSYGTLSYQLVRGYSMFSLPSQPFYNKGLCL